MATQPRLFRATPTSSPPVHRHTWTLTLKIRGKKVHNHHLWGTTNAVWHFISVTQTGSCCCQSHKQSLMFRFHMSDRWIVDAVWEDVSQPGLNKGWLVSEWIHCGYDKIIPTQSRMSSWRWETRLSRLRSSHTTEKLSYKTTIKSALQS